MRRKIVAGNWKMNTLPSEGAVLAEEIVKNIDNVPSDVQLILAPPFTHLDRVGSIIKDSRAALSAQNCSDKEKGAYTGEVSASMLTAIGCEYVILGHSERREYFHESSPELLAKVTAAIEHGLKPIYCVGEKLQDREDERHFEVVRSQIREVLYALTPEQMRQVVVAYEPVWAIGTGKTATAEQAQEIHAFIRAELREKFGSLSEEISILYGGSCKPSNAQGLFAKADIDGGLIGGAALKAEDFLAIACSF